MGRAGAPRVGELCEGLLQHCDAYNRIAFLEGVPRLPAASVSLGEPPSSGGAERDESGRLIFPDKSGGLIFLSVGGDDGDRLVCHRQSRRG